MGCPGGHSLSVYVCFLGKKTTSLYISWEKGDHLKCSAIGIGFNGAETNCGIARILGILLTNSCDM